MVSSGLFLYDRTFDGLLTTVFDAFVRKQFPTVLLGEGEPLPLFHDEVFTVVTDEEKSARVWRALEKKLSKLNVWALAFGCIIGWGSFVNPGKKFLPNSGVAGTAIARVLGAAVMVIIAFSYAYMIPKYPRAGGEFTFTKECFGKKAAFVCGWFLLAAYLTNVPMNSTAIGLIVDGLDGNADILKFGFHYSVAGFDIYFGEMIFATLILLLFAVLNTLGVKKAGFIQTLLSGMLVGSVFVLAVSALISDKESYLTITKADAKTLGIPLADIQLTDEQKRWANQQYGYILFNGAKGDAKLKDVQGLREIIASDMWAEMDDGARIKYVENHIKKVKLYIKAKTYEAYGKE